jgi:predicted AAA+ superfamily ATPase
MIGFSSVSKNTLHEYLGYLEDSFLPFLLPKQERSLRKQAHNPKKLHVIDPGLVAAFQGNPDRDVGCKLETTVFLHLRRQCRALYYYANGGEVDLCNEDGTAFWNTCRSLADPDTAGREQASLALGRSRARQAKGLLLDHEFASAWKQALPEAQPAWRWLLEQRPVSGRAAARAGRRETALGI